MSTRPLSPQQSAMLDALHYGAIELRGAGQWRTARSLDRRGLAIVSELFRWIEPNAAMHALHRIGALS